MPKYQVVILRRPEGWRPACPDDAPSAPGARLEVLAEAEEVFAAVRRAIQFNEAAAEPSQGDRWAVVVEPGVAGRVWHDARLCTPLSYHVAALWWPSGWEPTSPWDVPYCACQSQRQIGPPRLTYAQAGAVVRGLNQQSIDYAGTMWYVIVAVENEPIGQTVSHDGAGVTHLELRRFHVVQPEEGSGRGDCSFCPAHSLGCATAESQTLQEALTTLPQEFRLDSRF